MTTTTYFRGREITLAEVAAITGINRHVIYARYASGDRGERLARSVAIRSGHPPTPPPVALVVVESELPRLMRAGDLRDYEFENLLARWNRLVAPWSVKEGS